ncbi:Alpha-ketoglutarate-dependent dioxygenase alkB 2 [Lecanosticta acicola]|uniref:Alpha-ketoglutarate-dependent dioxygenase alkB 2 n=1 Tax=Lecanosticta acicola TaxID=111012 RepID=A0AAI8W0K4_9PEZI|nr:Alpha-ketoglutarate-dependent dioxygenase alkB 2 [Lecanosticta acicola]
MSSLLALLSQRTPNLQTRKGLILLGLQNDFVDGKLPVRDTGYLERLIHFIAEFRQFGHLIWVRSEFESTRPVNGLDTHGDNVIAGGSSGTDPGVPSAEKPSRSAPSKKSKVAPDFHSEELDLTANEPIKSSAKSSASCSKPDEGEDDEELFLSRTPIREPCCVKGTRGAEYADRIKHLVQEGKDMQVVKTHYSAFGGTSLLLTLRSKLITELYVAGNMTNLSVYATAMDAARYGIRIILVEDCLGYRRQDRHKLAIRQLCDIMEAEVMTSKDAISDLRGPSKDDDCGEESEEAKKKASHDAQEETTHSTRATGALEVDNDDSDGEVELPIRSKHTPLSIRNLRALGQTVASATTSTRLEASMDNKLGVSTSHGSTQAPLTNTG